MKSANLQSEQLPSVSVVTPGGPSPRADRTGRGLMALNAVLTLGAFAGGVRIIVSAADDRLVVEVWRTFAYVVFAGMWALIAAWPRRLPGVWELVLFHKLAVTVYYFAIGDVPEAPLAARIDLWLVSTTALAYALCRGWYGWRTLTSSPGSSGQPVSTAG
ncbi:hypothetical protein [Sorangium sp. So ce887]|uniref:hypothetical protein n=1 Tax=Sorangium sp. So ce887 TaxID=3133324 RepID=UPI003F5F1406